MSLSNSKYLAPKFILLYRWTDNQTAARAEWLNCSKPAPHVVCRDDQHTETEVTFRDTLNCVVRRTKAPILRWHQRCTRQRVVTTEQHCVAEGHLSEGQVTEDENVICDSEKKTYEDILAIAYTDASNSSLNTESYVESAQPLWSWGLEPVKRDKASCSNVHKYLLRIASDTVPSESTRVVDDAVKSVRAPTDRRHASTHSWFRHLASSLYFTDSTPVNVVANREVTRLIANAEQGRRNRDRWRHSFRRDFWSAFHQPYRLVEAVGWSTTLLLGFHLCHELGRHDRHDNVHQPNQSWTSLWYRNAFSTNDGPISATCTVLPKTQLVNNDETKTPEKVAPNPASTTSSDADIGATLASSIHDAANLYQNITFNSEAIRLAKAGRHGTAFALWERAARCGYGKAHYNLALCYELGKAVGVDMEKAVEQYRLASATGHLKAKYNLAVLHRDGATGTGDTSTADTIITLLTEAANGGLVEAQLDLGVYFLDEQNDPDNSVKWFHKAADNKNSTAQCYLGMCYEHGLGVERNLEAAADMYGKASRQRNALADLCLGAFYENGLGGLARDRQMALSLYESASSHGEESAVEEVERLRGEMEQEGTEASSDEDDYFAWMTDDESSPSHHGDNLHTSPPPSSFEWSSSDESEDERISSLSGGVHFGSRSLHTALAGHA